MISGDGRWYPKESNEETVLKILLFPGLDGTGMLFDHFQRLLPPHLISRVCALPTEGDQHPKALATMLADAHLADEDVMIIAESFSGPVAYELMHKRPDKIKGVVFVASFLGRPHPLLRLVRLLPLGVYPWRWAPAWVLRWLCVGFTAPDELVRKIQEAVSSIPSPTIVKRIRVLCDLETPEARCSIPCLYLQATNDRLAPQWHTNEFVRLCEDLEVRSISGPHLLLQARPQECSSPIIDLIRRVSEIGAEMSPATH